MNKRSLHHLLTRLKPLSAWYFLGLAVLFGLIFLIAYRQNNVRMLQLREAVFVADEQNGDVEQALRDLREHVHSHMHTDLTPKDDSIRPPIQLKYRYERLVEQEAARVKGTNDSVYAEAENYCEARFPAGRLANGRVQCVATYVTENTAQANPVPEGLYKFDFVSPSWSPDVAGWSLVLAIVSLFMFLTRFLLERFIRARLL